MSVAWHIFRKDCRRHWPFGAAAALFAVLLAFFPAITSGGSASAVVDAAGSLQWLVLGMAALAVVQDDLVVSDRADWITRPLGVGSVLGAKLLFFALVLVLPFSVITFFGASRYELGAGTAALVALDAAGKIGVGVLFFGFLAAATPSFLGAILAFAAVAGAQIFLQAYLNVLVGSGANLRLDSLHPSSVAAVAVLILGLLGFHYRRRQPRWSLTGLVLAALAVALLEHYRNESPAREAPAVGVTAAARTGAGFVGSSLARPFPLRDALVIGLEVAPSFPAGQDGSVSAVRAAFQPAGGEPFAARLPAGAQIENYLPSPGAYTEWQSDPQIAREQFGIALPPAAKASLLPVMALSGPAFERMKGASGPLILTLRARRDLVRKREDLPLEPGAQIALPGGIASILAVRAAGGPSVQVVTRWAFVASRRAAQPWPRWVLVNPHTGEVSFDDQRRTDNSIRSYLISDSRINLSFTHRWRTGSDQAESGVDASWLRDARLACVFLRSESLGSVELRVPRFTLPGMGGIE